MIEFKSPSEEDINKMRNFAQLVDAALVFLSNHTMSEALGFAGKKLQEALMWHNHAVLNLPAKEENIPIIEPEVVLEGSSDSHVHLDPPHFPGSANSE